MVRWAFALLLPMAGYVLLIDRPHLDVSWENHRAHFWLVLVGAVVSAALGFVMSEAAQRVRTGEITQAVRDGVGDVGPIKAGDWIAIGRDGVWVVEKTAADAAIRLVDRLVDDESELLTVLVGAAAAVAETARFEEHVALAYPQLEIEVHEGDQPLYAYLVGVE